MLTNGNHLVRCIKPLLMNCLKMLRNIKIEIPIHFIYNSSEARVQYSHCYTPGLRVNSLQVPPPGGIHLLCNLCFFLDRGYFRIFCSA